MGSPPNFIKLLHNFCDYLVVVGDDACFEVSLMGAFCAQACAGEVCAADVGETGVDDDGLDMYARSADSLHFAYEVWIAVEVVLEGVARLFAVEEP